MPEPSSSLNEIWLQVKAVSPTAVSFLIYRMPWLISLRFVGRIGTEELAAAAFANSLCNILGMAFVVGLNSALTTLASQAKGSLLAQSTGADCYNATGRRRKAAELEMASLLHKDTGDCSAEDDSITSASTIEEGEVPVQETASKRTPSSPVTKTLEPYEYSNSSSKLILPLVYLYRGLFVQFIFILPAACWWIYGIQPLLLQLGQAEGLSAMTAEYLRLLAPGLVAYSFNWTLVTWLQAIGMTNLPPVVAAVGLVFHIPITYLFVETFNWGYLGCAIATSIFQFMQPLQLIVYLFLTKSGSLRALDSMGALAIGATEMTFWKESRAGIGSISGILQYLGLAISGLVAISEWWASEILIVLAGRLQPSPEVTLGAMTLFQSLNSLCYIFPVSCSIAGAMRVGNLLGANNPSGAALASRISLFISTMASGMLAFLLMFVLPHSFFPSLFASSPDVEDDKVLIEEMSPLIPMLCLYIVGDSLAASFNGVLKGCGRQAVAVPVVLISYWVLGIPLSYYVTFIRHDGNMTCSNDESLNFCGVRGLVLGSTVGTWFHALLLAIVVICATDWHIEARKSRERVKLEDQS